MQIVTNGDNLYEMSNPVFWDKLENITSLSYAELAQRAENVRVQLTIPVAGTSVLVRLRGCID